MRFTLEQVMKAPEGEFWCSSILSLTSALDMADSQRHAPAAVLPERDPLPSVQESGWAPGPISTGAENLASTGIRSPDCDKHTNT